MSTEDRPRKFRRLDHDSPHRPSDLADPTGLETTSTVTEANGFQSSDFHDNSLEHTSVELSDPNMLKQDDSEVMEMDMAAPSDRDVKEEPLPAPEETAPIANSGDANIEDPPLSKSKQKKIRKEQEWEAKRGDRKLVRKQKLVAKRERKRAARDQGLAENGEDVAQASEPQLKKPPTQKHVQLPVTFLIDCDFDNLMRDNELISLAAQITRCYSENKNTNSRAHITVCSFGGKLKERFDNVLGHYKGWRGVRFLDCDFVEAAEKAKEWMLDDEQGGKLAGSFSKLADLDEAGQAKLREEGETVYLSSESDETLTELKPYSTYIIGGLVDKNREKGICHKRAGQKGVRTARLPIGNFMQMQSRKVLATNHVNEIMLKWLEGGDWGQAFLQVVPKRKGGKLKNTETGEEVKGAAEESGQEVEGAAGESSQEE